MPLLPLLVLAIASAAAQTQSPLRGYVLSHSNTRDGVNEVRVSALYYNSSALLLSSVPLDGSGDGLGQFGVQRLASPESPCPSFPWVYASNDASRSISVLRFDSFAGSLSLLPSLATRLPHASLDYEDVGVLLDSSRRFLFVSMCSSFLPNRILSYRVDASSGALSLSSELVAQSITVPLRISQMSQSPDSSLLAVSFTSVSGYVGLYNVSSDDGALSEVSLKPDQFPSGRAQGIVWNAAGDTVFTALTNNNPARVVAQGYRITAESSALARLFSLQASGTSADSNVLALSSDSSHLIVSSQAPNVVVLPVPREAERVRVDLGPSALTFVPARVNISQGDTVDFFFGISGQSVTEARSESLCQPKDRGFDSGFLPAGSVYSLTFDTVGDVHIINSAHCEQGMRMVVSVGPKTTLEAQPQVLPVERRVTSLQVLHDETVVAGLQSGGFSLLRFGGNGTLGSVYTSSYEELGLQGTSLTRQTPRCCQHDVDGPLLRWEPVVHVACDARVTGPRVSLFQSCPWSNRHLRVSGVQVPTCNAECDVLFQVELTDVCGVTSVAEQYYVHDPDVAAPVVDVSAPLVLECTAGAPLEPMPESALLSDDCQPREALLLNYTLGAVATPAGCPIKRSRAVTWEASDACGNSASYVQQLEEHDTLAPVFEGVAQEVTLACGQDVASLDTVVARDACDGDVAVQATLLVPAGAVAGCTPFERRLETSDACGNSANLTQRVSFAAGAEPVFERPQDIVIACGSGLDMGNTGFPNISAPSCVDLSVAVDTVPLPPGRCERVTLRTFRASKSTCGDWEREGTQSIVEIDGEAPTLWLPETLHVSCEEGEDAHPSNPAVGYPHAVDQCQGQLPPSSLSWTDELLERVGQSPHCLEVINRTWTARDGCGQSTTAWHKLYVTKHC